MQTGMKSVEGEEDTKGSGERSVAAGVKCGRAGPKTDPTRRTRTTDIGTEKSAMKSSA